MKLDVMFIYALLITLVLAFVTSILYAFRRANPFYLRFFPFYHATSLATEIVVYKYFSKSAFVITSNIPYNIFTFIEFCFYSALIFSLVHTGRKVIVVSITFFLVIFLHLALKNKWDFNPVAGYLLANFFLIVACLVYFNDIFSSFAIPNLSKEPSFWIVTGVMYYSIITSPLHVYLITRKFTHSLALLLYATTNATAYILLYLLLIKAYTCRVVK
jgi:hypothetical protein